MGLPQINISFTRAAQTIKQRSERGIVACIIADATEGGAPFKVYSTADEIDFEHLSEKNYEYLKLIFAGNPYKVIVLRASADLEADLKKLRDIKWNYFVMPTITAEQAVTVSAWIKEQRDQHRKTFKAVLPNTAADHEGIINFTTCDIVSTFGEYNTAEYCARIAGVLAGMSLARSATYFVLDDITSAALFDDADNRIDNGELLLIYDTEHYKIARGVNSLVSYTDNKGADCSKIKIIEGRDMYQDDIKQIFEREYLGCAANDYDNKQILVAAIAAYHRELEGDVLDKNHNNTVAVDIEAQRTYLKSQNINTDTMSDIDIAKHNTGSHVYLASNIKFVDAMEDMDMRTAM